MQSSHLKELQKSQGAARAEAGAVHKKASRKGDPAARFATGSPHHDRYALTVAALWEKEKISGAAQKTPRSSAAPL
jgi:hypothetical protein